MVGATIIHPYLSACSTRSLENDSPVPPMPCRATNTCSGLPGATPRVGVLTYTDRMGVPTSALLTPGAATTGVAAVHTTVDVTMTASQNRLSVRGIECVRV